MQSKAATVCQWVIFVGLVAAAASLGAVFKPGLWYATLVKPAWTPPNWLFAPVWTVLYLMIAIAGWLAWRSDARWPAIGVLGFRPPPQHGVVVAVLRSPFDRCSTARHLGPLQFHLGLPPAHQAIEHCRILALRPLSCLGELCGRPERADLAAQFAIATPVAIIECLPAAGSTAR